MTPCVKRRIYPPWSALSWVASLRSFVTTHKIRHSLLYTISIVTHKMSVRKPSSGGAPGRERVHFRLRAERRRYGRYRHLGEGCAFQRPGRLLQGHGRDLPHFRLSNFRAMCEIFSRKNKSRKREKRGLKNSEGRAPRLI